MAKQAPAPALAPEPAAPEAPSDSVSSEAPSPEAVIAQLRAELAEDAQRAAKELERLRAELAETKASVDAVASERDQAARARDELASKLADARDEAASARAELAQIRDQQTAAAVRAALQSRFTAARARTVRACSSVVIAVDGARREIEPGAEFTLSDEELSQLPAEAWEEI